MFSNLSDRLEAIGKRLKGKGRLTEDNIRETLREVRMALLEADVALPVVKAFIDQVRERALGAEVTKSLSPGQAFVKIVHDELVAVMGAENDGVDLSTRPPAVVMLAGLQGSGKTTSTAKLGRLLRERDGKKVLTVSLDVYRPAAIEQLQRSAGQRVTLWTAVAVHDPSSGRARVETVPTEVQFRRLGAEAIRRYVAQEQPLDCAGAFRAEGLGIALFEKIEGSDPNALIALPLIALVRLLSQLGIVLP